MPAWVHPPLANTHCLMKWLFETGSNSSCDEGSGAPVFVARRKKNESLLSPELGHPQPLPESLSRGVFFNEKTKCSHGWGGGVRSSITRPRMCWRGFGKGGYARLGPYYFSPTIDESMHNRAPMIGNYSCEAENNSNDNKNFQDRVCYRKNKSPQKADSLDFFKM